MADLAQLESALVKADAAGDTEGATILAGEVRKMRGLQSTQPSQSPAHLGTAEPLTFAEKNIAPLLPQNLQGSQFGRFIQGASDLPVGAIQLVANAIGLGPEANKRISDIEKETQLLRGSDANSFDPARLVGNIASPLPFAAVKGIAPATTIMGKVAQGAGIGGLAGLSSPVTGQDYGTTKAVQGIGGAALGAAIPAASSIMQGAYNLLVKPLVNPTAIKNAAFIDAAGNKAPQIIDLLKANQEIVPGSLPTAGEAASQAGSVGFSALQKNASKVSGPTADQYLARGDTQNAARLAQVRTVGKDAPTLDQAVQQRAAEAAKNYGDIANKMVNVDNTVMNTLMARPSMAEALRDAKRSAQENGAYFPTKAGEPFSVANLQRMKESLDAAITASKNSALAGRKPDLSPKELTNTKDAFVSWLSDKVPEWKSARVAYSDASKPINQMQIGQFLEQKLVPATAEDAKQRALVYAGALQNAPQTIKKATDSSARFDELAKALTPKQLEAVNSVKDDLARSARFEAIAAKGSGDASKIATSSMQESIGGGIPSFLQRGLMYFHTIVDRVGGKIDKKLAAEMAAEMLNPPKVAESMQQGLAREARNKAIAAAMLHHQRTATTSIIQGVSNEAQ